MPSFGVSPEGWESSETIFQLEYMDTREFGSNST
jgi:hypothetical protein